MNATSRDLPGAALDETIAHRPPSSNDGPDARPAPAPRSGTRYAFNSGERPLEGYTIKRAIGRGGFGEVYYATSDAGKEVALKLITRNLDVEKRGVQQCMNLKSHHLITVFDMKTSDEGDSFVVMEYIAGQSLAQILAAHPNGLPPAEVRFWLKGLVDGVSYLHDHGIVHRDLKPANLFLEEGVVKIGDYGLSKAISHSQEPGHSESVGTCHYMAPEIASGKYHKPIDIYAIGIILYEMVTGRVPFDGESVGEVLMKHLTALPDLSPLPEPYRSIVRRATAKDPNHRPARAVDLLPAADAPIEPPVRFIGDGRDAPPHAQLITMPTVRPAVEPVPQEDVLRIEQDVFYIGPNTMPPRPRSYREVVQRWADARKTRRPPAPPARPVPQPAAARRPAPPPEPPPEPEPLPSGRVRLAELATAMLCAAPVTAVGSVLALPLFPTMAEPLPQSPAQLAYLFVMTLLGTWGVLVAAKGWEGRGASWPSKRLTGLGIGLGLGLAGLILADWTHLRPSPTTMVQGFDREFVSWNEGVVPRGLRAVSAFAGYFALAFGLNGWWKIADRDRSARFRFWPTIKTGLAATLVGALWPSPQPWGAMVVVLTAIAVQVVSPWSRQSALYARYMRRRPKTRTAA